VEDGSPKAVLYGGFARVGKALGNPARIELLDLLAQGERGVEELAAAARLKVSNTSAQLKVLAAAGLVTSRRSGTRVVYRISGPRVTALAELAKQVAFEQLPGVRDAARGWLGDIGGIEPVTRAELGCRMRAGRVLVIDVRPAAEYAAAHIAGAVSIPLDELPARLAELPRSAEVVAYCRGRFCVMSLDAVRLLREHGYRARPMDGGLPEWRDEGMPVAAA
jgi:rhodanese-related sulfurtransferase/DNA-binding transcriptional ArsR family regulator